jgi:predicted anti-sigma-YlaC factor YlaD
MTTPDSTELTCKELVELVTDYLEGALSSAERQRFGEHLDGCSFCKIYVEQMRQTIGVLGCLPEEAIASDALDALRTHFRNWR